MPLLNYALIIIGFPIVLAILYDIKIKYNKKMKIKEELQIKKDKEQETQWENFILEKYNEMKIWNSNIEYEEVRKMVLDNLKN